MKPRLGQILRHVSLWRTLRVNFALFPVRVAMRFPVLCGRRCDVSGLRRGAVVLSSEPRFGMVVWGISTSPRFPVQGLWTLIRFSRNGTLTCGAGFIVRTGVSLFVSGRLVCGEDVLINQRALLVCSKAVTIGPHVRIGWDAQILDSDCHLVYDEPRNRVLIPYAPVVIGRNVWIASRANVGKGAKIPDYSIVARGALMLRDFSSVTTRGNVFAGVPAELKATGRYRLLDIPLEGRVSKKWKNADVRYVDAGEIGLDVEAALNPPPHTGF